MVPPSRSLKSNRERGTQVSTSILERFSAYGICMMLWGHRGKGVSAQRGGLQVRSWFPEVLSNFRSVEFLRFGFFPPGRTLEPNLLFLKIIEPLFQRAKFCSLTSYCTWLRVYIIVHCVSQKEFSDG